MSLWNTYYLSLKVRKFEKQFIWSSFRSKFRKNSFVCFFGKYKWYLLRLGKLLLNFPDLHTDIWDSPQEVFIVELLLPQEFFWLLYRCRIRTWPCLLTSLASILSKVEHFTFMAFEIDQSFRLPLSARTLSFITQTFLLIFLILMNDELSKLLIFYVWNSANFSSTLKKISSVLINSVRS